MNATILFTHILNLHYYEGEGHGWSGINAFGATVKLTSFFIF